MSNTLERKIEVVGDDVAQKLHDIAASMTPRVNLPNNYTLADTKDLLSKKPTELSSGGYVDWAGDAD